MVYYRFGLIFHLTLILLENHIKMSKREDEFTIDNDILNG